LKRRGKLRYKLNLRCWIKIRAKEILNIKGVEMNVSQLKELLRGKLTDVHLREEDCWDYGIRTTRVVLVRGEEVIFDLSRSEVTNSRKRKPHEVAFFSLEALSSFVSQEIALLDSRKTLKPRINALMEDPWGQKCEVGKENSGRLQLLLYDSGSFRYPSRTKRVESAHRISYRGKLYELTEESISLLEEDFQVRADHARTRRERLRNLFLESLGVFTKTEEKKGASAGHSLGTGKVRYDEWVETTYYIGGVEITKEEYEWLNSLLPGIQLPAGFIRVKNDTNDILP
jgi:hypothetical protein